ncbi:MAG: TraR/DksA C4-type zinc finger protein [Candidatus Moranbacteria bacterium]|nr:TraR/DksA C4-type zinc finger protein [Candidatus Moranbacteria bacterium]
MTIDSKTLAELKEALLTEKAELESNLNRIAKPTDGEYTTTFDEIGNDREDNTTEVEEYTDNLPVEQTLVKKLHEVTSALAKMENGTYGICDNCKQEIAIERLQANPSAQTCIKC